MNRIISSLLVFLIGGAFYLTQAQTSTWSFAESIGLSGVQFYAGSNSGVGQGAWTKGYLMNSSGITFDEEIKTEMESSPEDFKRESNFTYSLGFVFHPFLKKESAFLRNVEWIPGIDFRQASYMLLTYPNITNGQLVSVKHVHPYRIVDRSVFLSNQMNWTRKWGRIKLHTGPTLGLSMSPGVRIVSEAYTRAGGDETDWTSTRTQLASSKFFVTLQYRLGFQYNINCRFNAFAEGLYSWSNPKMADGNLSGQYVGVNIGFKFKFQKDASPDAPEELELFW